MFEFANPWLLLLLPIPAILVKFRRASILTTAALRVPFFEKIVALSSQSMPVLNQIFSWKNIFLFSIWFFLVVAAAGPQWLGAPVSKVRIGRDMMLAVDLSGSMEITDMSLGVLQLSRLDVVKSIAGDFIQQRQGDRLGLILFGSRAYLQTPLTFDRTTVLNMLNDATIGLAGPETAIGDAIGLAVKRLQIDNSGEKRVLILLTDGINNSGVLTPRQAADLAAKAGIRIYTIGVGSDSNLKQDSSGSQPHMVLDEQELRDIAQLTGGLFFRATDVTSLKQAYQMLDQLEPVQSEEIQFRPIKPLYPWPLAVALLLAILLIIKGNNAKITSAASQGELKARASSP